MTFLYFGIAFYFSRAHVRSKDHLDDSKKRLLSAGDNYSATSTHKHSRQMVLNIQITKIFVILLRYKDCPRLKLMIWLKPPRGTIC